MSEAVEASTTCDSAEVPEFLAHKAGDVGPQGEADQVGLVVDVPKLLVDRLDEECHLGTHLNIKLKSSSWESKTFSFSFKPKGKG